MMDAPPYETCMAMRKGASHPQDPSPCMGCPSCRRNQYRREMEIYLAQTRETLLGLRSDMREPAEREGGLMRHFYDRICTAITGEGPALTNDEQIEHLQRTRELAEQTAAERLRIIEEQAAEIDRLRKRVEWFESVAGNTPLVVELGQVQLENYRLAQQVEQLEKDYGHAVETIQEIVNRVRPLLPVALAGNDGSDRPHKTYYCPSCPLGFGF